jgi:outer membrane protein assembly factor BamD (BamD/ComL family)
MAPPAPALSALDAEIALLRDARSALHGGDAAGALSLLDAHDRLYPAGALGEDAAAERIYALCALGQTSQARALAARFLAAHPSSPHAASVGATCGAN